MTGYGPATLSAGLLAHKGSASVAGFERRALPPAGAGPAPLSGRSGPSPAAIWTLSLAIMMLAGALGLTALLEGRDTAAVPDEARVAARNGLFDVYRDPADPTPKEAVAPGSSTGAVSRRDAKAPAPGNTTRPASPRADNPADRTADPKSPGAKRGIRVQLHALRSPASAWREWRRLKETHTSLFDGLSMTVASTTPDKSGRRLYRLLAGPLESEKAARQLCHRVRKQRLDCVVVRR